MNRTIDRRGFLAAATALSALSTAPAAWADVDADGLYREAMVIDGNLVAPLDDEGPIAKADADAVRASGLTALKITVGGSGGDFAEANTAVAAYDKAIAKNSDLYLKVNSTADLIAAKRAGKVGIILSFESAAMLEDKVDRIDHFGALGVRVMQLSYNLATPFAHGVMTPQPSPGLTALGREAVARMNAVGVTLDLSHADAKSTLDACAVSAKPVLITHAGCDAVYTHPRNKTDAVLRAVADKGGVVGIYELSYLSAGPEQQSLADYLAHLEHALKICGEDHVGIGSDAVLTTFDTSPAAMVEWNKDIAARKAAGVAAPGEGRPPFVEGLNRPDRSLIICRALLARGHKARVVEKVLGSNFQRVFAETWPA